MKSVILFRLNHWCHRISCVGGPGDIIEVSQVDCNYLLARKGGEIVAIEDATAATPDSENQVKKQEAEEAEAVVIAADQRAAADLRAADAAKGAKARAAK